MYVDDEKVKPDVPVPLKNGSVVCFGVNTDINDLRYYFVCQEPKTAILRRCRTDMNEDDPAKPSPSPPHLKVKRGLSDDQRSKTEDFVPKKKPKLSHEKNSGVTCASGTKMGRLEKAAVERDSVTLDQPNMAVLDTPTRAASCSVATLTTSLGVSVVSPKVSPKTATSRRTISPATSSKPSPALSVGSTVSSSDVDELFETRDTKCTTMDLDEAIFGKSSRKGSSRILSEHRGLDAASLQIQLAKEQMEEEKHKLLSSIEALKSELAAKDQLLAQKDEKTKAAEGVSESVMSSIQEEFTCVICQELFINAYTLPCAHSFCEWCIKEWMKRKGHKDCPICRKKITSDPVHSLALDNAVSTLVDKLSTDERKERQETELVHKVSLEGLNPAKKTPAKKAAPSSRMATRSTPVRVTTTRSVVTPSASTVVIDLSDSPLRTTPSHSVIHIDTSTESESDSDDSDSESDDDSESEEGSDSYDSGVRGAYYGGYGRCFSCGKFLEIWLLRISSLINASIR